MAEATYPPSGEEPRDGAQQGSNVNKRLGEFRKFASTSFTRARQVRSEGAWKMEGSAAKLRTVSQFIASYTSVGIRGVHTYKPGTAAGMLATC